MFIGYLKTGGGGRKGGSSEPPTPPLDLRPHKSLCLRAAKVRASLWTEHSLLANAMSGDSILLSPR